MPTDPSDRTFLERYGGVSAFIAGTAALVYILGLFSLWAPIATTYTADFSTAWYAVSLIPNTTVAGQGVKQLVVGPLAYLLVTVYFILLLSALRSLWNNRATRSLVKNPTPILIALLGLLSVIVFSFIILYEYSENPAWTGYGSSGSPIGPAVSIVALFIPALVGIPVGLAISRSVNFSASPRSVRVTDAATLKASLLIGLVVVFLMAFVIAALRLPPLPTIKLVSGQVTTKGKLLTHADGFWYLYNDPSKNLMVIPDEKVDTVVVCPQTSELCQPRVLPDSNQQG